MQTNDKEAASAVINIGKLYRTFAELECLTSIDKITKDKMRDFRKKILDDLKVIQLIKAKDTENEDLSGVVAENSLKGFVHDLILKVSKESRKKHDYKIKMNEKQKLRIALAGETSAGKTTFCNSIFSTNIFFVTQEEATGAAVEIENDAHSGVEVYDKNDKVIDNLQISSEWFCEDGKNLTNEGREKVKEFITRYTRVGSEELARVGRVKVFMPLQQLPKNIILIDTPGFNANNARSEIAKKVISESHACVFIIDARNALKSKELKILETIREEVGKTFIVLNKMDLVMADDDLDCDDEDIEVELIDRVKRDLKKRLDMDDVMLYPVCSLGNSSNAEKAKQYVDNLHEFVDKMLTEIVSQRIEFLIDTYAKETIKISNSIIEISKDTIESMEEQKTLLEVSKPKNFDARIEDIWNNVFENYKTYIQDYKNFMVNCAETELNNAKSRFLTWVNSSSKKEIRSSAQNIAEQAVMSAANTISSERSRKLREVSSKIINDVVMTIQELYDDLPFKVKFNSSKLMQLASTTATIDNSGVQNAVKSITSGKGTAVKGAIVGAMVFGPAGALVGGALGSLLGDSLQTVRQKVYSGFCDGIAQVKAAIMKDYENDASINNSTSFANKLRDVMVSELNDYVKFINDKIKETLDNISLLIREGQIIDTNSKEINSIISELNNWRNERRNISLADKYAAAATDVVYSPSKTEVDIVQVINSLLVEFAPDKDVFDDEPSNEVSLIKDKVLSSKYVVFLNKYKKELITTIVIVAFLGGGFGLYKYSRIRAYNDLIATANNEMDAGYYDQAINLFQQARKYKDNSYIDDKIRSAEELRESKTSYESGTKLMDSKKYLEAIEQFKKVKSSSGKLFNDAQTNLEECKNRYILQNIQDANNSLKNKKFDSAISFVNNIFKIDPNNADAKKIQEDISKAIQKQNEEEEQAENERRKFTVQIASQMIAKALGLNLTLDMYVDFEPQTQFVDKEKGVKIIIFADIPPFTKIDDDNKQYPGYYGRRIDNKQITYDFYVYQDGSVYNAANNKPIINSASTNNDYILPNSDKQILTENELRSLNVNQLTLARNEIFARHGYVFTSENIKSYFKSKSWYHFDETYKGELNDIENTNVQLINKVGENKKDGTSQQEDTRIAVNVAINFVRSKIGIDDNNNLYSIVLEDIYEPAKTINGMQYYNILVVPKSGVSNKMVYHVDEYSGDVYEDKAGVWTLLK